MMMIASTIFTRRVSSGSIGPLLRSFSTSDGLPPRPPPPPRTPPTTPPRTNRFVQTDMYSNTGRHRHVSLRTKAISMFHANYEEDDTEDSLEADQAYAKKHTEERDAFFSQALIEEEERRAAQKARWLENSKPPVRVSEIDNRGRAYGRGGRKTSTARVWIQAGTGEVVINRMRMEDYIPYEHRREHILEPFICTKTCGKFDVTAWVEGGGTTGQSGAIRHGIARALNHYNPDLYRAPLKFFGLLTRDPRVVERKKVGLKKARKAPQWVKR